MRRLLLVAAVAVTAAAALTVGGILRGDPGPARAAGADDLVREAAADLQRVRETGDPASYRPAEQRLRRALALEPDHGAALRTLAALAASRHRFAESLRLAERARRAEPHVAAVYGLLGDAALELGRYQQAFAAFDRQARTKPSTSAYARVAYGRELLGDLDGAAQAMALAVEAAPPGEPGAWARVQLANLLRDERLFHEALVLRPGYAPALQGLAELGLRRGRHAEAIALLRRADAASADPGPPAALGDALALVGRRGEAERAWARAEAAERRFAAFGGRNALETAEFDLDHDRRLPDSLRRARQGYRERPSVEGAHVLAWALYKNGRCAEARRLSEASMRLGAKDVDGLYHRSLIERCLGNAGAARRYLGRGLALDPLYLRTAPSSFRLGS